MRKAMVPLRSACILATVPTYGQGLYIKAGASYALPMGKQEFITNDVSATATSINETLVSTSYGKGIIPTVGIGFMFTEFIGFELAGSYLIGGKTEANVSIPYGSEDLEVSKISSKASSINLLPAIVLKAPVNGQIGIYSRTGLTIPIAGKITTTASTTYTAPGVSTVVNQTREVKGNMTVGIAGGLGVSIKLNNRLSFWAEANGQMLNVWSKTAEVTQYEVDGSDLLPSFSVADKEVNYVKELTQSSNNEYNPSGINENEPYEEMTQQVSFHNLGIGVGIAFHL